MNNISLRGVHKAYPTKEGYRVVLRNVSLDIPRGKSLGILGTNGAGKSTLIRLLAGIEYPDKGDIERFVQVSSPLGLVGSFNNHLTGRENARFVARLYDIDWREMVDFIEDFAELGPFFDEPVRTYSSGMRARLAFAVSISVDFDVYLIDEVTAVGDARFRERCARVLAARRDHSDVIMVSHSVGTIRRYCDYAAILHDGQLEVFEDLERAIAIYRNLL
jgi:capsular polysaccharide transport system ATP-binding protein